MADAFGGSRNNIKPPERGVFALDHQGECKNDMKVYLSCLDSNKQDHFPCKEFSARYLKCRMDRDLMAKEDLDNLGLGPTKEYVRVQPVEGKSDTKESKGFIAGTGVVPGKSSAKGWGIAWNPFSSTGKSPDKSQSEK
jgi:cytochrome c oxidase assembly protein subunit 19